jgi:hypothetical protein
MDGKWIQEKRILDDWERRVVSAYKNGFPNTGSESGLTDSGMSLHHFSCAQKRFGVCGPRANSEEKP